ncbi:unnamed protein product [Linum tenue]|uniref:Ion transport domain-containing protein n=1 Tax=Linum tenue TaxID=586396 RepID=A0AAV0GSY0_9ROSI|nr:unnamed protein product [Linum tenue]
MAAPSDDDHRYETSDDDDDTEDETSSSDELGRHASAAAEEDAALGSRRSGSLFMACCGGGGATTSSTKLRRRRVAGEWNRIYLLACAMGLFVDPLFFYALSVSDAYMCLFVDGWFALTVTALRCMNDLLHLFNLFLRFTAANHRSTPGRRYYLKDKKGFFLDLFVILPIPQIVLWVAIPSVLKAGSVTAIMTLFLVTFLVQYLPKIYHSVRVLRRMQDHSGYIFGTVWWGIFLNLIAYFVASHAAGGCWYLLGIQRAAKCLEDQCKSTTHCIPQILSCRQPIYYGSTTRPIASPRVIWAHNNHTRYTCLSSPDHYSYGAYKWTVQLVANENRLEKVLLPIFWGLMTLSTFGNLESTTEWVEVVFNIISLTGGVLLVTMLIGNIKVFLNATTSKKQAMQLRMRNLEWWMRRRQLPVGFRQRVRNYERQKWAAMRGVDEYDMIRNLPEGIRRDIKYHLCLDLVRQVPLFQHMRRGSGAKNAVHSERPSPEQPGPARRREELLHAGAGQLLRRRAPLLVPPPPVRGAVAAVLLQPHHAGDDGGLRPGGGGRQVRHAALPLHVREGKGYKHRLTLTSLSFIRPRRPLSRCSSLGEDRLRLYTALLTSPKPNQDDFDF